MDLLTGSTGFLGRHLAQRLAADGRRLRALVRAGTDKKRIPAEITEIVWGGLDEPAAIERAVAGIDTVPRKALAGRSKLRRVRAFGASCT